MSSDVALWPAVLITFKKTDTRPASTPQTPNRCAAPNDLAQPSMTVPRPVPEDLGSDIEDRDEALQPDLTEAERNRKTSGEARAARDRDGRKCKLAHLTDHLTQELWDAFQDEAVQPRVEACSERALLASLGLGLLVRGLFTIRVADPLGLHDQPVYTDIPVSQAAIPDLSCRNLYLQLCRGPPGNGANTQPNAAVAAVLAAHPDRRARLAAIPRHPSDTNMVDHMAKFGEGDPRWLVEERVDGTNVNGWHWVEKDAIEWCRMRLPELLVGPSLVEAGQDMELAITGLDTLTGEATINNRKNKIIPAYELEIKLAWQGSALGKTCQGKIHLPYLADENHDEEPDLRFSSAEEDAASQALKTAFLTGQGKKTLVSLIKQFVAELRAGGPAAPSSSASPAAPGAAAKPKLSSADPEAVRGASGGSGARATSEAVASAEGKGKGKAGKGGLRRLDLTEQFYCRAGDVYDCLTVEGRFKAFTQSAASIDPRPGGKLTWFGGAVQSQASLASQLALGVQGEFSEVQPGKRLAMSWRFNNWAEGVTSQVIIDLAEPEPGHTVLTLQQTGIPEADQFGSEDVLQLTERGWRLQVFQRIRQVFGYGLGL
ncbi:hypothetical protein QJQ45_026913 [Haematococcus lacustris]|nr:hypothetical protein QJQ45_026913 [Haematococcus lacustris]